MKQTRQYNSPQRNISNIFPISQLENGIMRLSPTLRLSFKARTTINPSPYSLFQNHKALAFSPRSLLLVNTANNLSSITNQIELLVSKFPSIQIYSATLDSNHTSSISELWIDKPIFVKESKPYKPFSQKTWDLQPAELCLQTARHTLSLRISNDTLFTTGDSSCMFYYDGSEKSWTNLSFMCLKLPLEVEVERHHISLVPLSEQCLEITSFEGNIIKKLNGRSAAGFLVEQLTKYGTIHKVSRVYARLEVFDRKGHPLQGSIHEIVAGGGEWGPGSEFLVLENATIRELETGKTIIKFFIMDTNVREQIQMSDGISIEQVHAEERLINAASEPEIVKDNLFVLGSASGFQFNGIQYKTPYELLGLRIFPDCAA